MADITIRGADELERDLKRVLKEFPDAAEIELNRLGNKFKKIVQDKTPEKTGRLKKSYKLSKVKVIGNVFEKEFYSNAPHFHLIERGHIQKDKQGKEKGFIPGVHIVERSVQEFDSEFEGEINKWLDKVLRELDR